MKVSVILPTFNEAENILKLIEQIKIQLSARIDQEIIVVDDNSPDQTFRLVQTAFQGDSSIVPVLRQTDRGLANSIRAGIEKASGDQIIVMDTDLTHDPTDIPKLLHVGQIYDLVSASRFCPGGNMQDTQHYLASMVYNWFIRLVIRTQVQDNLGGYFTISRSKLNKLPLDKIFFGYGDYFFRLLHFAQRNKMTVVEIPSIYRMRHLGSSKSNFSKLLFSYTGALVKFKMNIARINP